MIYLVLTAILYAVSVGVTYAYFQRKYPTIAVEYRTEDGWFALFWSLFVAMAGPVFGLIMLMFVSSQFKFGWLLPFTQTKMDFEI